MRKPSIGILHYTCPPVIGGVESVIAATARMFASAGYPVHVFAGRGRQFHKGIPVTIIPELDSKNPQLLAVNEEMDQGRTSAGFDSLAQALYLSLQDHLTKVDVCFVHNALSLHFNLPLTAALHQLVGEARSPRMIAWCHDLAWTNPLYLPSMRYAPPWSLLKRRIPGVKYVVVSQERQRELAGVLGVEESDIYFVPNGVDPASFLKLSPTGRGIAEGHDLFAQDVVLLLPARITARKNIELAIRVSASLRDRGLKVKLIVTGPPGPHNVRSADYVNTLLDLRTRLGLAGEVVFLYEEMAARDAGGRSHDGEYPVSDGAMTDLFHLSDLLFFPSSQEGFGIPILEAGFARLPVFCSDIPPFKEVGLADVHFFTLNDSPNRIADSIATFVQDDPSCRLRKRVIGQYTWTAIFKDRIEPLVYGGSPRRHGPKDSGLLRRGTEEDGEKGCGENDDQLDVITGLGIERGLSGAEGVGSG